MLEGLTVSQQMFMLFFSILYGIMLNSLIGYGAFPIAHFFAREDIIGEDRGGEYSYAKGKKNMNRFLLSLVLLNLTPLTYFALVFIYIIPFTSPFPTFLEILFIAFLSLGVFAFLQFFLSCVTSTRFGHHFYTQYHFRDLMKKKGFHPKAKYHIYAGIFYLFIPWLFFVVYFLSRLVEAV